MPSKSSTRSKGASKSKAKSKTRSKRSKGNMSPVKGWALEFHSATVIPATALPHPRVASGNAWNRALPFKAATLRGGPKYKTKHNVV